MIAYMLVLVLTGADMGNMIPTLSAFAFAAVRLMPS